MFPIGKSINTDSTPDQGDSQTFAALHRTVRHFLVLFALFNPGKGSSLEVALPQQIITYFKGLIKSVCRNRIKRSFGLNMVLSYIIFLIPAIIVILVCLCMVSSLIWCRCGS